MNLVNLETAVKAYGPRVLLDGVSLGVSAGDRIGVVGRNGAGKTTLLAALAGAADLDSGRATRAREVRLGYLPQSVELTGSVREAVFGSLPEHEWAGDARRRGVVAALLSGIDAHARSSDCPAASAAGSRWPRCCSAATTCCCWTSRPTTWTWRRSAGSRVTCASRPGRWWWSRTTAGSSTR